MKKNLLIVVIIVAIFSCQKEIEHAEEFHFTKDSKIKENLLTAFGFDEVNIQETIDGFTVEGDIYFPKKDFWALYGVQAGVAYRSYRTQYIVTKTRNIPVSLDSKLPTAWKQAYRKAMAEWNALNGKIKFTETFENMCPVNGISVVYQNLGSKKKNTVAETQLPTSSGIPGNVSTVNSNSNGASSTSKKKWTAVHELGHAIGFGHSDHPVSVANILISTSNSGCNKNTDPNSVMQPIVASWDGFSFCDKKAFEKIYPR